MTQFRHDCGGSAALRNKLGLKQLRCRQPLSYINENVMCFSPFTSSEPRLFRDMVKEFERKVNLQSVMPRNKAFVL